MLVLDAILDEEEDGRVIVDELHELTGMDTAFVKYMKHFSKSGRRYGLLISNWVETLRQNFPALEVVVFHGSNKSKSGKQYQAFRMLKDDVAGFATYGLLGVAPRWQYLFDQDDPRARSSVIVSAYKTWVKRTLQYEASENNKGEDKDED